MRQKFYLYITILTVTILPVITASAQIKLNEKLNISGYKFSDTTDFPLDQIQANITFSDNGSVGGNTGCNTFAGMATLEKDGRLAISRLRSTERACSEILMKFEQVFLQTLESATRYTVTDGVLTLTDSKTQNFLRFGNASRASSNTAAKTTKETIYIGNKSVKCTGIAPMACLRIKRVKNSQWQNFYDTIDGFEYKPGKFYKIEVERTELDDVPKDTSIYRYKLVRLLKCVKKENDLYN